MNEAWTGPHLQRFMQRIDYWSGGFTSRELELMYRAENGDFNWMYNKDGFPRAGYIKFWQDNGAWMMRRERELDAPARAFSTGIPPDKAPYPGALIAKREKAQAEREARKQARLDILEREAEKRERNFKRMMYPIGTILAMLIIIALTGSMP